VSSGERAVPAYVENQLAWYTRNTRGARIGFYVLELLAIGLAAAVPVATVAGTSPWVIALLGSGATAVAAARHVFGFDRNWTGRAVTAERIRGRVAPPPPPPIDAPQLVAEVSDLVDRETAGWGQGVRTALGHPAAPTSGTSPEKAPEKTTG
jgi:hypothetical protein